MAEIFIKLGLAIIVALCLISSGNCQCDLSNIEYGGKRTGRIVGGKPEWDVFVYVNCRCSMGHISFTNCEDFQTTEPVDPAIFYKAGNICLLKQGQFLKPFETVRCSMGHISFTNCEDFQTTEPVDPAIFYKAGNICLLKQGQFLKPFETVSSAELLPFSRSPTAPRMRKLLMVLLLPFDGGFYIAPRANNNAAVARRAS
ncbi:hypothetical protein Nepgr_000813 [Nepenthes gracilis]|uniref:Uncharacterized protein n=1 Tax=Nepenthes gracilis TaxID=150966 RepID=A0AAD3P733_NEPGR|nr:hypothetical protein Nepgr_000813 [Nepenthes gracilis]